MTLLKWMLPMVMLVALTACGGGSSSSGSTPTAVTGVDTASQISVVTAQ